MRKILLALLVSATALTAFGCSRNTKLDPADPTTISIWHVYGNQTASPFNDSIEEFNRTIGRENGVIVSVGSLLDSVSIDEALIASASDTPGSSDLPDLFTAYPRVAESMGDDILTDWTEIFTEEELSVFVEDFLEEGSISGKQLTLPIAKSTELLFLNRTLFDRFSTATGVKSEDLSTFEGLFDACIDYYDWCGKSLFQYDDMYNYFLINVSALGGELIKNGKVDCTTEQFEHVFRAAAEPAVRGGLSLYDNYATDRWASGDIISFVGSSAGILYARDEVIYADNTSEKIEMEILPYPSFAQADPTVIQRGVTLFAVKKEDERREAAIKLFVQWLIETENNLDFVTQTGYIPGTDDAFEVLFSDLSIVENDRYRMLYEAVSDMYGSYRFQALPVFQNSGNVQNDFIAAFRSVLSQAHEEYLQLTAAGENADAAAEELIEKALIALQKEIA